LLGEALTLQEDRLTLMPGNNMAEVEAALGHAETLVLYKAGRHVNELCDLLERQGLLECARVVCYAEIEGRQFVSKRLEEARDGLHGYMTTILIHVGHRTWVEGQSAGLKYGTWRTSGGVQNEGLEDGSDNRNVRDRRFKGGGAAVVWCGPGRVCRGFASRWGGGLGGS
jgi:hypothetical protein